jgi:hypothetical protein
VILKNNFQIIVPKTIIGEKMKKNIYISILLVSLCFSGNIFAKKHAVGGWDGGFFSAFLGVLNHLYWCEKTGNTPAIYWGKESLYWQEGSYNGTMNAWEYYFEPVSSLPITENEPRDMRYSVNNDNTFMGFMINPEKRFLAHSLIQKYIRVKSTINHKIESFYTDSMKNIKTIGIHLRGTDKSNWIKAVNPLILLERANVEANLLGECQFLVTTDEYELLELATRVLKRPVIYYPCERSKNHIPLHIPSCSPVKNRALLGEDMLIEALLLARCDLFLHTDSNVSAAVLYFNPFLKNISF